MDHRETKLNELRRQIMAGDYDIDAAAVADAMLRSAWSVAATPQPGRQATPMRPRRSRRRVGCRPGGALGERVRSLVA